jgi:Gas vesicle synthesis protein GvpO
VLATYELILDDDRKLVSADRKRRYRRSQVDEAS